VKLLRPNGNGSTLAPPVLGPLGISSNRLG
jgi:hypothetical protein